MNFKNMAALDPVKKVINEANAALQDPTRTIEQSDIPEVLGGALGAVGGGAISFAALYGLGTVGLSAAGMTSALAVAGSIVGGGMAAGVAVLAAPVAILGIGATAFVAKQNKKKLAQAKSAVLADAIRARDGVIRHLKEEVNASKARLDELHSLNILLEKAIEELESDARNAA